MLDTLLAYLNANSSDKYVSLLFAVIGVFSSIATVIPAPKEDSSKVYKALYSVLSWVACNFGQARNAGRK